MSIEPLVLSLKSKGEIDAAVTLMEALYRHSFHYEEYDDLAKSAFKAKQYKLAIKYGEDALTNALTNEKMWTARSNLINVYNHANLPEKALRLIRANEAVIPTDTDTRLEKAFSLYLIGRRDEAEQILRNELLRLDLPDETRTKIMFNLGTYELYRDNFLYGLELFQIEGQRLNFWKKLKLEGEYWMGQPAEGRDILVYAEAGVGDEFINVRFMKNLAERGMNPIWYTERAELNKIFNRCGFKTISNMRNRPANSLWTYSMTLPLYLEKSYENLWEGDYITSLGKWDKPLFQTEKLKVGIRWAGNPEYDQDLHRTVDLDLLMDNLLNFSDELALYSLQRDTDLEMAQKKDWWGGKLFPLHGTDCIHSWESTLRTLDTLDIVITSCTSVAHAAAALGKRTFVFVPLSAYYIWSHSTKQSPWYGDNVTVLRQQRPRVWDEPIAELVEYLKKELPNGNTN